LQHTAAIVAAINVKKERNSVYYLTNEFAKMRFKLQFCKNSLVGDMHSHERFLVFFSVYLLLYIYLHVCLKTETTIMITITMMGGL